MSIGVTQVDKDHAEIVDVLNACFLCINSAPFQPARYEEALARFVRVVRDHHHREEAMMRDYDHPGFEAHAREHERMKQRFLGELTTYKAKHTAPAAGRLHAACLEIFASHLQTFDRAFGMHVGRVRDRSKLSPTMERREPA